MCQKYLPQFILLILAGILISSHTLSGQQDYIAHSDLVISKKSFSDDDCVMIETSNKPGNTTDIIEFESRPFFVYTHPQVRRWMTDKFLIVAEANISKVNETVFMQLFIQINSPNARGSYGDLDEGQQIKVIFKNGDQIVLRNIERDKGRIEKSEDRTLYQGVYPLNKQHVKDLSKNNIYKLGIIWEEGYEEYEVHNIDLIRNQLSCLK